LNIESCEFLRLYCRWVPLENGKTRLSLKEKSNYDCIFWKDEGACFVYEARPLQCRAFPFWASVLRDENSWRTAAEECPGMDHGSLHSLDSIKRWMTDQQNEPIISGTAC
jgi:Fe-S-cluster containining protein